MAWRSAQAHSIDQWQEISTNAFVDLRCRPLMPEFAGSLRQIDIMSGSLAWVATDALQVERMPQTAQRYTGSDLLLTVQNASRSAVEQAGRVAALTPGSAAFYDPHRPYLLDFPVAAQRLVVVTVDRRDLPFSGSDIDRFVARPITPDSPGLAALTGLLQGVSADAAEAAAVADLALPRLLTLMIDHLLEGGVEGETRERLVSEIKDWMRQHLADENLSVDRVANQFFVSKRALHSLFAATGRTPAAWLREQRATYARQLLVSTALPVAGVGAACGYPDPGTFTRFFKQETGLAPSQYRREAR